MPKSRFGWDACIFIAYLKGERRTPDEAAGLLEVVELISRQQATIITSAVIYSEVLNGPTGTDRARLRDQLTKLILRPQFMAVDANFAISEKAGEIRERVARDGAGLLSLKRNDAIYAATSILYRVEALHTFDPDLLLLSDTAMVDGLHICAPRGIQTTLGI